MAFRLVTHIYFHFFFISVVVGGNLVLVLLRDTPTDRC